MIEPEWLRIAGLHVQDDGEIAVVWMARNRTTDTLHLYDACLFKREVLAVIAEGLNARGRWIPVAWEKAGEDMADKLLDRGCNMLPEPAADGDPMAEVVARDIWERMRSGRFKVDKRLGEWLDELKGFQRKDGKVPKGAFPLMSATRHAVAMLEYARRQAPRGRKTANYPKVAIL